MSCRSQQLTGLRGPSLHLLQLNIVTNCTCVQELQGFEENDALMLPDSEDAQLKDKDISSSFELRSTQIILTTQTVGSSLKTSEPY